MLQQAYAFEPDTDVFLRDFGADIPVVSGSVQGLGIYSAPGEMELDDGAILTDESVIVRNDLFGSLRHKDSLTVAGIRYTVRESIPVSDGVFVILSLQLSPTVINTQDWGFITDPVTNTQDWGLITDPVTVTQDWGDLS